MAERQRRKHGQRLRQKRTHEQENVTSPTRSPPCVFQDGNASEPPHHHQTARRPKRNTDQRHVCRREDGNRHDNDPTAITNVMVGHGDPVAAAMDVMKAADADRAAVDAAQAGILEQRHNLTRIDMPVT